MRAVSPVASPPRAWTERALLPLLLTAFTLGGISAGALVNLINVRTYTDSAVAIDAHSIQVYVEVLSELQGGDIDQAVRPLEDWLGYTVVRALGSAPYTVELRPVTVARADSAFEAVAAYRRDFRTTGRLGADELVRSTLALGAPGRRGQSGDDGRDKRW